MRYLIFILLLVSTQLRGANGDITGAEIEASGWTMRVFIEGMRTNGTTFNFGLGTNNSLTGNEKIKLTLTQPGFDDTGTSNNVNTIIYGTKQLRKPYPEQATMDVITNSGAGVIVRVALSEYIYAGDGTITATIGAGFYGDGSISNNSGIVTVTNNSVQSHQKCIANWSWPGWNRITNNTMTLRAVGFHRSGREGRPLRVMKFQATDGYTTQVVYRTQMEIDRTIGDPVAVQEYIANIDVSGFTNLTRLRCDFTAYPWVGNTNSTLTTTDGINTGFTPLYAPQTNFLDRLLAWGNVWAIVSPSGNDSTGMVGRDALSAATNAFLTINGAATRIAASNNVWYSHNDLAGAVIYLMDGNYQWTGGSSSYGNVITNCWVEVTKYPTSEVGNVVITNQSGSKQLKELTKLSNVKMFYNAGGTKICFDGEDVLWINSCEIDENADAWFYQNLMKYFTLNTITNIATGGVDPYSTVNSSLALIRSSKIYNLLSGAKVRPYNAIGNIKLSTNRTINTTYVLSPIAGGASPLHENSIVAFNATYGLNNITADQGMFAFTSSTNNLRHGVAIIGNLFEAITNASQACVFISADSCTNNVTNVLFWNNTIVGQRLNASYNDANAVTSHKIFWSVKNNSLDDCNIKSDTFNHGTFGPSGVRTGNWSQVWGVSWSGNFMGNINNIGAVGFDNAESGGISGLSSFETQTALPSTYQQFINRKAYDGTTSYDGNGNYRLHSYSPLLMNIQTEWLLPYDLEGNARSKLDPPGAYSSAVPKKGSAMGGF